MYNGNYSEQAIKGTIARYILSMIAKLSSVSFAYAVSLLWGVVIITTYKIIIYCDHCFKIPHKIYLVKDEQLGTGIGQVHLKVCFYRVIPIHVSLQW